jgi:hypothetical protein
LRPSGSNLIIMWDCFVAKSAPRNDIEVESKADTL